MVQPEDALARMPFVPGTAPIMIERAEGSYLFPTNGEPILDAAGGAIVTNIGHGRPEIAEAAAASLGRLDYVLPTWATPERVALHERLRDSWLPDGLTRIGLLSGGSESTDSAIRLAHAHHVARGNPERRRVIGRWPSYHGATLAALSASGHAARRSGYDEALFDFPFVGWDDADALDKAILDVGAESISAFIAEPVIGAAAGALVAPDDYFRRVREICDHHGVLLIVDEVMTGFGRCGARFAIEDYGVTPDILVGGKGLAGGYSALGMMAATDDVVAPLGESSHNFMFFTFGAQPVACAIADTVLRIVQEERLVERSATQGDKLRSRLEARLGDHPHVSEIRGRGLMLGVELVETRDPKGWYPVSVDFKTRVVAECMERNVWVYPAGSGDPVRDALLIGPPFTISDDEIDTLVELVAESIDAASEAL